MDSIPNLAWTEDGYEGKVTLEYWEKVFQLKEPITIEIGGDMVMTEEDKKIPDAHISAYEFLLTYQKETLTIILEELLKQYPQWQELYGYEGEEQSKIMPCIDRIDDLLRLIKPIGIHIINVHKDEVSYIGYEFNCSWDDEHGLGAMLHKDRIIEIGEADCSFTTWIAEEDLENK